MLESCLWPYGIVYISLYCYLYFYHQWISGLLMWKYSVIIILCIRNVVTNTSIGIDKVSLILLSWEILIFWYEYTMAYHESDSLLSQLMWISGERNWWWNFIPCSYQSWFSAMLHLLSPSIISIVTGAFQFLWMNDILFCIRFPSYTTASFMNPFLANCKQNYEWCHAYRENMEMFRQGKTCERGWIASRSTGIWRTYSPNCSFLVMPLRREKWAHTVMFCVFDVFLSVCELAIYKFLRCLLKSVL